MHIIALYAHTSFYLIRFIPASSLLVGLVTDVFLIYLRESTKAFPYFRLANQLIVTRVVTFFILLKSTLILIQQSREGEDIETSQQTLHCLNDISL